MSWTAGLTGGVSLGDVGAELDCGVQRSGGQMAGGLEERIQSQIQTRG